MATIVKAGGKNAARQMAEALRTFDGLDAVARFRAELGGWHVYIRAQAPADASWPAGGSVDHCYVCGELPVEFVRSHDVWVCGACDLPVIP